MLIGDNFFIPCIALRADLVRKKGAELIKEFELRFPDGVEI